MTRGVHALAARLGLKLGTASTADASAFEPAGAVAAGLAAFAGAIYRTQAADSAAVNNSTTMVALANLLAPVEANTTYVVTGDIVYSASTAADVGIKWAGPTGFTMNWTVNAATASATANSNSINRANLTQTSIGQCGAIGVGTKMHANPIGTLHVGSTAGNFQLQFAQFVADATDAIVHADSWIKLEKKTT